MEGGHCKVKAREIKKALEKEYEDSINEYHSTLRVSEVRAKIGLAKIRELEFLLVKLFDVHEKFEIYEHKE